MQGLMQRQPLLISSLIRHAARHHGSTEIVSRELDGSIRRTDYAGIERRARRLADALRRLGVGEGDRVATLAWNSARHLEIFYAVSGMGAVCHTVNPRLAPPDIAYILNHAEDRIILADTSFVPLIATLAPAIAHHVRGIVLLADAEAMAELACPAGMDLHCYETLIAEAGEGFEWPVLDENTASGLCYTSGTTGRPKGVLYSHRSAVLNAYGINLADAYGLRAVDRVMPVSPMFHVNAWALPFAAPMTGSAMIFPGRHLDGASLTELANAERATFSCGVPTVWLGVLQHLRSTGARLETLERVLSGGSAVAPMLIEAFAEYGVRIVHAWGMSETSPVATTTSFRPGEEALDDDAQLRIRAKQGRALFGLDMKITDDAGTELPWDGRTFGNLLVRGYWVCERYFGANETACDAEGWFATGDVATIDASGAMEITDRIKDVIKSGGEWISSIALENIALEHPDIAEAAVIAAKHERWIERPLLLVLPREGREVDPASVLALYEGRIARWWLPDAVLVVEELPHTATGKLQKTALRARYEDHLLLRADAEAPLPSVENAP
jgi:3-(methylthio)propionyl---CoA ligase